MRAPVTVLVVGAGGRGTTYATWGARARVPSRVVAVAEPDPGRLRRFVASLDDPPSHVFADWREAAAQPRLADAVFVTTQDRMHTEPAIAFARLGYDVLLEKPMSPDEDECERIVEAVEDAGVLLAVCHVLRYTPYTRAIKEVVDAGRIGQVVSVQHLEPVASWHFATAYVRGPWAREADSSPMLLAKSCHDLDWIRHIVGRPCRKVSSFGGLFHFRPEERPTGATDRCLDCPAEPACVHSAPALFLPLARTGGSPWLLDMLGIDRTEAGVLDALRTGPYGRCVYAGDNDVVDHQVVNMAFEGGATASFTVAGFTSGGGRRSEIFGTRGHIVGDMSTFSVTDLRSGRSEVIDPSADPDPGALSGHGGGDAAVVDAFLRAVATRDPSPILSGPRESLETHRMVFAAERARHSDTVVHL